MFNFVVSTVPADALAPLGARASAGTVMTMHALPAYCISAALQRLVHTNHLMTSDFGVFRLLEAKSR